MKLTKVNYSDNWGNIYVPRPGRFLGLTNSTVAFAIKKSDSVPIADTSGELFMIVFIRDIGNWSVPISPPPVTFSEAILIKK